MAATELRYGIPDIHVSWSCGGTVNPSSFAGHQLIILFLPQDPSRQHAEFESYEQLKDELSASDAWFLVIADETVIQPNSKPPVALDPDGKAWRAFNQVAGAQKLPRGEGAVFFFTRGGTFHKLWQGPGHAREVLEELLTRA